MTVRAVAPAPPKPTNRSVSVGAHDGLVTVSWDASEGAATYRVGILNRSYRADETTTSHTFPASALATLSGRRYATVSACNSEGACSSKLYIRFTPPPPAPTGLQATADGENEVDLTWGAVVDATRYEVEYKETTSIVWIDATGSATTTSETVDELMCGTEYEFRVRAHGDGTRRDHWGPWSDTASASTSACLGAPTNVRVIPGNNRLVVLWDPPEGEPAITGYEVTREAVSQGSRSPRAIVLPTILGADARGVSITGLMNDVEYSVAVKAFSGNADERVLGDPSTAMAMPQGTTITVIAPDSIDLATRADVGVRVDNGVDSASYKVRLSIDRAANASFNGCDPQDDAEILQNLTSTAPLQACAVGMAEITALLVVQDARGDYQPLAASVPHEITVTQANRRPTFDAGPREFSVSEDASTGTIVGTVSATDPDGDRITYAIGGTTLFEINDSTGAITSAGSLSMLGGTDYNVSVTVSDGNLSTTENFVIHVINVTFPTLAAPAAAFEADGATAHVEFVMPHRGLHYLLTLYRSTDNGESFLETATHEPRIVDDEAYIFTGVYPDTTDRYKIGFEACRDAGRTQCSSEVESAVFRASTVPRISIDTLADNTVQGGLSTTFSARYSNLSEHQTYALTGHTATDRPLRFDGCGNRGEDPKHIEDIENTDTDSADGIIVFTCVSENTSDQVYATISIGNIRIARSNDLTIAVTPVPVPSQVRAYGTGSDSVKVRWNPVPDALFYTIKFNEYAEDTGTWTEGTEFSITSPTSRTLTHEGQQVAFLEKEFNLLDHNRAYSIRMRAVSGVSDLSNVRSDATPSESAWAYPATSLPASTPPLAHPAAPHEYVYSICAVSLVSTTRGWTEAEWETDIVNGLNKWADHVQWLLDSGDNIVKARLSSSPGDCSQGAHRTNNVVKGAYMADNFRMACNWDPGDLTLEQMNAEACTSPSSDYSVKSIIFWTNHNWDPGNPGTRGCSEAEQIAAHEGGHVFGVGAHTVRTSALMLDHPTVCDPTAWDAMMVLRGFQVR